MEKRLRTLKDLTYNSLGPKGFEILVVKSASLKQEAIKRIKFFLNKIGGITVKEIDHSLQTYPLGKVAFKNSRPGIINKSNMDNLDYLICGKIEELILFFNITEEDLKDV